MADNIEKDPMPSFGIENTMELGLGDQELLADLIAPESTTENPEDITPIVKETPPPAPPKKPEVKKGKEVTPPTREEEEEEEEKGPDPQRVLKNYLGDDSDDEEEGEEGEEGEGEEDEEQEAGELEKGSKKTSSTFTALAKDLYKLGVFTKEDDEEEEEITTPQQFLERFNEEKKKGAIEVVNNFIARFGEDYQAAFEAIYVKGVSPREYFGVYNQIVDFAEMDLKDESNQVAVVRQMLTDQGYEPEDVTTEIERLKNYGDLADVATKHHKVLVKRQAAKLQQMQDKAQQEQEQKAQIKNQYIQNVQSVLREKLKTREFDGIPINPKLANELQDFLLVDKWKTASGETITDFDRTILELKRPENHAVKVKIALLLKILEKDPTLSTIQKAGISKQSTGLFDEVVRQKSTPKTGTSKNEDKPRSWFS